MTIQGDPALAAKHIEESMKLDADGYAHLFSVRMTPPEEAEVLLTFSPQQQVNWQGYVWRKLPCNVTDVRRESTGEMNRPKFSMANPEGVFHRYAMDGYLDNAEICQYLVLGSHLQADANSFNKRTWRVGRIMSLTPTLIVLELREAMDAQQFILPARSYYAPEFPSVSLT